MMPVTLFLIGVNVVISILGFRASGNDRNRFVFSPYRFKRGKGTTGMLLSHFSHADPGHLFLNMLGLWFFGPVLEAGLGPLSLALIYVVSGLTATAAIFAIRRDDPRFSALGASGSIAGVLFAAIVLRPDMDLFLLFIPIPIPAPIFAILYIALSTHFMGRQSSRICHEAHIGGALAGTVLGVLLAPYGIVPLLSRLQGFFS